jgi:hypothetical protein
MHISFSNSFKTLPIFIDKAKEYVKFKVDPAKVIQIALQVFALVGLMALTYACPLFSLAISVGSFLWFHSVLLKDTKRVIKHFLKQNPSFSEANEKIPLLLKKVYAVSQFRIVADICRLAALCLTFQPVAIPLLIANGTMMAVDALFVKKAQAKINALVNRFNKKDEYLLHTEQIQISNNNPGINEIEGQVLCALEKQRRPLKEKYKEKQIQWISIAWAKMLDKHFDVEDASGFEVYNPLTQLSVVYELEDKNVFSSKECPPSLKKRHEILQKTRREYQQLSHEQKNTLKLHILTKHDQKICLEIPLMDLFKQIGQLADIHLRAGLQLQKGMRLGTEKHYFWKFQIGSFLRIHNNSDSSAVVA